MTTESLKHLIHTPAHKLNVFGYFFSTNILDSSIFNMSSPVFLNVKSELEQSVLYSFILIQCFFILTI